jgi:hypothetical protein
MLVTLPAKGKQARRSARDLRASSVGSAPHREAVPATLARNRGCHRLSSRETRPCRGSKTHGTAPIQPKNTLGLQLS